MSELREEGWIASGTPRSRVLIIGLARRKSTQVFPVWVAEKVRLTEPERGRTEEKFWFCFQRTVFFQCIQRKCSVHRCDVVKQSITFSFSFCEKPQQCLKARKPKPAGFTSTCSRRCSRLRAPTTAAEQTPRFLTVYTERRHCNEPK